MAIHCVAAEHGGSIKKKESSWVKYKAFPTNVVRPNYEHGIRKDNCLKKDTKISQWKKTEDQSDDKQNMN